MKLTVLGNRGPLPLPGEACSSYLISHEGHTLLIDAGAGSLPHLLNHVKLADLDAVILSHLHFDHCSDALVLQYSTKAQPLPLYCLQEPGNVLEALMSFGGFTHQPAQMGDSFAIGPFTVTMGPARHPIPCNAVKVEAGGKTFVFTGDSNDDPRQVEFAQGADLLLADAGMTEAAWTPAAPHRTSYMCGELASQAGVKRLMLTHFGPSQSPEEEVEKARAAFDGEILSAVVDAETLIG